MSVRTRVLTTGLLLVIGVAPVVNAADPSPAPSSGTTETWSGPALTTTPMSAEDAAVIDQQVEEAFSSVPDLPGMWIGVWDPEKGYYMQAYGDAVIGGEQAAIDQHGRIGSVTKTFTTAAILQQVAAGNLSLDSTIGEVLPDLAAKYPDIEDITVEQLAGMTSGIQDYANTAVITERVIEDPTQTFTADDLIDGAMTLPLSPPGTGGYSTTNTIILGQMLEEITGKPVDEVVTEVARSVGMADTALTPADVNTMPEPSSRGYVESLGAQSLEALGLDVPPGTDVTDWTVSWGQAGGAMYSTIEDLGTWAGSGLGTSLLPADLAAKRFEFQEIPEGQYGLGLFSWDNGWIGHTGQLIGWESIVLYNRDTGAAFVAIVNETGSLIAAKVVAATVLPDLFTIL